MRLPCSTKHLFRIIAVLYYGFVVFLGILASASFPVLVKSIIWVRRIFQLFTFRCLCFYLFILVFSACLLSLLLR